MHICNRALIQIYNGMKNPAVSRQYIRGSQPYRTGSTYAKTVTAR
ncbi:hypothetical protein GGE35_003121 [Rhizobium cellulosilyticum]|uniref:Uncharacterized protein n=2 Tax=Rhizobiaceae TaxID=82115 RepID=A0A7W6UZP1_9HYPH|nr:hypothetical protein [Rhizobium cellulosilyticum]MBB4447298.1 hypothetical protein [Rhizobium cellulosilyticum]MBB6163207.1 hypothetical protein [Rhizobium wenxiniae]